MLSTNENRQENLKISMLKVARKWPHTSPVYGRMWRAVSNHHMAQYWDNYHKIKAKHFYQMNRRCAW